ncbi:M1 family metallopeptidase [Ferruginibacter lapsinanis]|uniref:M1 family metallopeptidase n=1 Tax=Ferruginibacter lapsinanis TaxID=563172 RepID=UPI001E403ADC|nr:M1 family metallopeptidase [Ferruginibacter lapsinanis]UEG48595.1 M1 family metallopeptidase [Ferruginibacter lapsinanis]
MKRFLFLISCSLFLISSIVAQPDRWQQKVKYTMNIDMDAVTNKFTGKQKLEYTNNSPDVLNKVFYHLYFNAFQPNSSMDMRSRELGKQTINGRQDWDGRVRDRILNLKENEIGYQKIVSLKVNGVPQPFKYHETILEVNLTKPILPKSKVVFDMEFEAQVPLQVRRSGRDNPNTGVRYSMSQWYPKLCEYDQEGWHPTPYIAREFYGVWGDFDVTINIDKTYKIGGTGVLINANEIGWGYDSLNTTDLKPTKKAKRIWHFIGNNVHDFVWAADPDYKHLVRKMPNGGPMLHVIYNYKPNDKKNDSDWEKVADAAVKVLPFIETNFGKYPYPQYSFIQGGDGGMEYPMATLLNGPGLGGVFHEWMHSWYQMMLGTNESMYAWMDEGFTSFAENLVTKFYDNRSSIEDYKAALANNPENENLKELLTQLPNDHCDGYASYFQLVKNGLEEPLTTHADHFNSNFAYSIASYCKGEVFLEQLGYILGASVRDKILLEYYKLWRFKHPNADDFIQVAEKTSGIKLDWYKEYWCNTTKTIDYSVDSSWEENGVLKIRIKRIGQMPMPVDLQVTLKDGSTEMHYVPLNLMYGEKPAENTVEKREVHEEWRWTHPVYIVEIKHHLSDLKKVEIDPSKRMADVDRKNNVFELN